MSASAAFSDVKINMKKKQLTKNVRCSPNKNNAITTTTKILKYVFSWVYWCNNEHIRSTVKVEQLGMKMREGRLRWYGHVMRRDQEYVGRKMMEMELPGKRRRGRPKRRFLDAVKEDMQEVGVKETDVEDRKMWRMMIRCGHP